jgi:fumarate reductase subunit D
MTKRRLEPLLWLAFSGGGVISAVFLPVMVVLFGLAIPLGWVRPDYGHLHAVFSYWLTRLVVLGLLVLMLFHWASVPVRCMTDCSSRVGGSARWSLRRCGGRLVAALLIVVML